MLLIANNLITKYSKNYASENNAIKATQKAFGADADCKVIIINKEGRFFPLIKWSRNEEHRIGESVSQGFYTFN